MTIVDESMKLILMLRQNGWIQVSDNDIWDAVGKDVSFSKVMRQHSVDVTRRMGASSSPPPTPKEPPKKALKAAKAKKAPSPASAEVLAALRATQSDILALAAAATKREIDEAGRAKWTSARWEAALRMNVDPAKLKNVMYEGAPPDWALNFDRWNPACGGGPDERGNNQFGKPWQHH